MRQSCKGAERMKSVNFNKKIFSMLIEQARGDRSIHRFANDAGISYVQLRKLYAGLQENPPGKKLIKKLAESSLDGIEYEDYIFAAGISEQKIDDNTPSAHDLRLLLKLGSLSAGQRKTAEEFIDFLYSSQGRRGGGSGI